MADSYLVKIKLDKSIDKVEEIMKIIPAWRREKAIKFCNKSDQVRCIMAYLLIAHVVRLNTNDNVSLLDMEFSFEEFGKPKLVFPKGYYVNISHSGEWVACVIDKRPVGIDIEQIKSLNIDIAKKFFTSIESTYINKQTIGMQGKAFCKLWAIKESYVKALGNGMYKPFNTFQVDFRKDNDVNIVEFENITEKFNVKYFEVDSKYILAVTANSNISIPIYIDEKLIEGEFL
ncbi:4'-phosphopantetheinyl transferase family protein [Clostridium sp.]|uniref:4'-phosphopantetheinyl transferase family protein n=1 Tax=Clostridium sp. TaxID=1506 RepID=UPI003D6D24F2